MSLNIKSKDKHQKGDVIQRGSGSNVRTVFSLEVNGVKRAAAALTRQQLLFKDNIKPQMWREGKGFDGFILSHSKNTDE